MAADYAQHIQTKNNPPTEKAAPGQVLNNTGGYVFQVDDWVRLDRFLILGGEGGTYYVKERELTKDNAGVITRCLDMDPVRTVNRIVEISDQGRAPKNDPAIFALALAMAHPKKEAAKAAIEAVNKVCRIGTHIFQFAQACDSLRGWGAGLKAAVAKWYTEKDPESLAYQVTKYQQRNGWSHKDLLRLCHAKTSDTDRQGVFRWIATGTTEAGERIIKRGQDKNERVSKYPALEWTTLPKSIIALESLKRIESEEDCVAKIKFYGDKAPRELVPTKYLTSPKVWDALLENMPMTAMIRNLGNMSKCGLIAPMSEAAKTISERIRDREKLKKARVHPLNLLVAMKTYQSGKGLKGSGEWQVNQQVVDALNDSFYLAFEAVEPTNKRWAFGLDVSGSMGGPIAGLPITSCEAVTALSFVTAKVEPYSFTGLFSTTFTDAPFGKLTRLDDAMKYTQNQNFGATDCSLLMEVCIQRKIQVDVFCVMTDNEVNSGSRHPFQALKDYRNKMGVNSKLIVVATTATGFSIADPSDAGMLDVCGFDTSVPAVMSDFARN